MKKVRLVLAVFLALGVFRWVLSCGTSHDAPPPVKKLTNRVWSNRAPDGPRDRILNLVLVKKGKRRDGAVVDGSAFRFRVEVLRHRVKGRELTLVSPQDGNKMQFQARTWRCDDAPPPFDLCLELKSGKRRLVLFSEEQQQFSLEESSAAVRAAVEAATQGEGRAPELGELEVATSLPVWFERFAR